MRRRSRPVRLPAAEGPCPYQFGSVDNFCPIFLASSLTESRIASMELLFISCCTAPTTDPQFAHFTNKVNVKVGEDVDGPVSRTKFGFPQLGHFLFAAIDDPPDFGSELSALFCWGDSNPTVLSPRSRLWSCQTPRPSQGANSLLSSVATGKQHSPGIFPCPRPHECADRT